ncbi:hypothetical protein [Wenxinia saemankumensis]|uniref:Muramidase (Phage lambda lysozyme) n=1 Tax=Wenxinia saemankumensis TaxID=1447782 RepID=A0A1M6C7P1_9RHOB|nr:hypothetical protein [Wenxinia saemankumensis]SHI56999.1 hypothetical protein SAMN05444417_1052 [Wenxinia saemankumensis]
MRLILTMLAVLIASPARADGPSLFRGAGGIEAPLLVAATGALFAPARGGLFGAAPPAPGPGPALRPGGGREARLFDLIAAAEAGPLGYDAVNYGARVQPPRRPTQLTIGEILAWVAATPGQPHAIGRYQIIPPTLRALVRDLNVPQGAPFTPALQDRLAMELLMGAGYADFLGGDLGREDFMLNLARVWAGLPTASGQSYYHGHAGNRASITWARFDAEMRAIFPGSA